MRKLYFATVGLIVMLAGFVGWLVEHEREVAIERVEQWRPAYPSDD